MISNTRIFYKQISLHLVLLLHNTIMQYHVYIIHMYSQNIIDATQE